MITKQLTLVSIAALTSILFSCESSSNSQASANSNSNQATSQQKLELDANSFLIFVNRDEVFLVNPQTGSSELLLDTDGTDLVSTADAMGELVVFTGEDNGIGAMNINTREPAWYLPLGEFTRGFSEPSAPVCDDRICYAVGDKGTLIAIDGQSGEQVWFRELSSNADNVAHAYPRPLLVSANTIYASIDSSESSTGPTLFVINRNDGTIRRQLALRHDTVGRPVLTNSMLIVSTYFGIQAFDNETFEELWRYGGNDAFAYSPAIVVQNTIVFNVLETEGTNLDTGQKTLGIDLVTGADKWSVNAGRNDELYMPTTNGQTVFSARSVTCQTGGACNAIPMAINPTTGRTLWNEGPFIQSQPLAVGDRLFYGHISGTFGYGMASLDANTGRVLWVGEPSLGSAPELVHKGVLYRNARTPDVVP